MPVDPAVVVAGREEQAAVEIIEAEQMCVMIFDAAGRSTRISMLFRPCSAPPLRQGRSKAKRSNRYRRLTSGCFEQSRVCFEHHGGDALAVGDHFAHHRKRGRARRRDFADHAAEIEAEIGIEFARQLLHAAVVCQTIHLQKLDASISGSQQRAGQQLGTDAVTLPVLFDAERRFGRFAGTGRRSGAIRLHRAMSVDEKAVHDGIEQNRAVDMVADMASDTAPPKRLRRHAASSRNR